MFDAFKALKDGMQLAIILGLIATFIGLTSGVYFWYRGKVNTAVKVAVTGLQLDIAKQSMKLQDRATEATWKLEENVLTLRKKKDAEIQIANAKYNTLAQWVRAQPASAGSNNSSANGASTTESAGRDSIGILYRQNASDLAEYAKDAETLRQELLACYSQYDLVKTDMDKFKKNNSSQSKK